jgi:glycerol kinase
MKGLVLAIDQGTTGTRAVVFDEKTRVVGSAYREFKQYFPKPGWVEHDPEEIWRVTKAVIKAAVKGRRIAAIGITNQRETTVLWDRTTGRPVRRAIVWQDRRTAAFCDRLRDRGLEPKIRAKTGLVLDPYFSASKIRWMLDADASVRRKAKEGRLAFGTIDSWLLWKLTGGEVHATDLTNASRTMLLNIKTGAWDADLLKIFGVPAAILPRVLASGSDFGWTADGIPVRAMLGDQQAALFGQGCYGPGEAKNTYGTGCFLVVNSGPRWKRPPKGLLATLACGAGGEKAFALEGSVFVAGAAVQWLRDGLGILAKASETERLARSVPDTGGVVFVPALAGLGAPFWNAEARGELTGLTRGTTRAHVARAALEAVAHRSADVVEAMGLRLKGLKVDGGMTGNGFLMQLQADLLQTPVFVSEFAESTAWGAAKLAGIGAGIWKSAASADRKRKYRRFSPKMGRSAAAGLRRRWRAAVERVARG